MNRVAFEITVPATTANLGPGFDSLGLALRLYNRVRVEPALHTGVDISGEGRDELPRDDANLMLRAAAELGRRAGRELPPLRWGARHRIPLARGLGSSSAALVAGLLAADAVLGLRTGREELVRIAAELEGHPDNVAPALLGGLTICLPGSEPLVVARLRPHRDLRVALLIPDHQVSTRRARRMLPKRVLHADAVFNLARAAAMVAGLREGRWDVLGEATRDRLHQPYRLSLMPKAEAVMAAALEAGAAVVTLSGSGPTVAAFCAGQGRAVAAAMAEAAAREGLDARTTVRRPDSAGARVEPATHGGS